MLKTHLMICKTRMLLKRNPENMNNNAFHQETLVIMPFIKRHALVSLTTCLLYSK